MAERPDCTEGQLEEIEDIHRNLGRIVKLNKSLLLLSRIENGQFHETKEVEFNPIIKELVEDFQEIYEHKNLHVEVEENAACKVHMNESLANILITNLLKNAMIHTPNEGSITIRIQSTGITFTNSTDGSSLDQSRLFTRFYQADNKKSDSTGLGLAIIQSIVHLYHFHISYSFDGKHQFDLRF